MTRAKDNPFRTERVLSLRYRPQGTTWDEILSRLERMNYRAAIVGPHGAGKTTLIEDLRDRLDAMGHRTILLRLNSSHRSLDGGERAALRAALRGRAIVLLDGAEQLGWWRWGIFKWSVLRASGLIIASHVPGLLPTLVECQTSPALLHELASDLGGSELSHDQLASLHMSCGGNIRDALRVLYDRVATG